LPLILPFLNYLLGEAMFYKLRILYVCSLATFIPGSQLARAWDKAPSFSEWRETMEKAFKIFQAQEDKLLDSNDAKTIVFPPREWRTAVKPYDEVLEAERQHDPAAVQTTETCYNALGFGAALVLKVRGMIPSGDTAIGLDGDVPYDKFATAYIKLAEECENGLHIPHPVNKLRVRFR
jgi:hypothetical protein